MASRVETAYRSNLSLIVAKGDGRMLTLGNGATLAVFSGEREAKMFLFLGVCKNGWKVRQTSPGELFSMLDGARASVKKVALDPSPEMVAENLLGLVSVGKDRFLERFANRGRGLRLLAAPRVVRETRAVR